MAEAIGEVEKLGRIKETVWGQIKLYPKVVYNCSQMLSALPTTQVSVERMFSQLKLLLRDNRARLGPKLTEALLFMITNKCV